MVYCVHQVGGELHITLSLQAGAALGLCDGAAVELTAVDLNALPEGHDRVSLEEAL